MLTDIFATRYENVPLFEIYSNRERKIFFQAFTILEELRPYWGQKDSDKKMAEAFWTNVHKRVSNELGFRWLSEAYYTTEAGLGEYRREERRQRPEIEICRNWVTATPPEGAEIDVYVKNRLSLIEVGLRLCLANVETAERYYTSNSATLDALTKDFKTGRSKYEELASELNVRFKTARFPLNYHNGFIQIESDSLVAAQIEQPFWSLVSDKLWENVDIDMKEALDQRDSGGKDPALYAARALESTIKIASDELGVTHGGEKGAHSYIDNLGKKNCQFLTAWEPDALKLFFTKVRNPLGHGPGKEPMPTLTQDQTDWAIEHAMSWTKLVVARLTKAMKETK